MSTKTKKLAPEQMFDAGFTDLISVMPPGAQIAPSSAVDPSQVGKVPGVRLASGLWVGYNWLAETAVPDKVSKWVREDGANIGLRTERFPAIDIDSLDETIASVVEKIALDTLGPAPIRVGRAPKRLLLYRTDAPFGRLRLWINNREHLVEVLGKGQQFVVHGTHPYTQRPFAWDTNLARLGAAGLTTITFEDATRFVEKLALHFAAEGVQVEREGDGKIDASHRDQDALRAPSMDVLRHAVNMIPNDNEHFASRESYLRMGYAIKAAAGEENEDEALSLFLDWALRWEGNAQFDGNDPDIVMADWRRMHGPYEVGYPWIAEVAREFGYSDASVEFEVLREAPPPEQRERDVELPMFSDQWVAARVVAKLRNVMRVVPERGTFLVWDEGRWKPDATRLAEDLVKRELGVMAARLMRMGATEEDRKKYAGLGVQLASSKKLDYILRLIKTDRSIVVSQAALDHDPWILNTPAGIINLRTGEMAPANPDALCTMATSVAPDFEAGAPEWKRFLLEATGGDTEMMNYLQRLAGYCATGVTKEQMFAFFYGPGGNGKGTFINTISAVLNDYAKVADMSVFTASNLEKHSTDLAMLANARLVTAAETSAGKQWDSQRVKGLTGGDPVTARFMRQDNFTYKPKFKLVFSGNHRPEIPQVDKAMRRRIHLVPFDKTPAQVDTELDTKLLAEAPAILAWMIEGCLMWQRDGLKRTGAINDATEEYFEDEDSLGQFIRERMMTNPEGRVRTSDAFRAWEEWAGKNRVRVGSIKTFVMAMKAHNIHYKRTMDGRWFLGVDIDTAPDMEVLD